MKDNSVIFVQPHSSAAKVAALSFLKAGRIKLASNYICDESGSSLVFEVPDRRTYEDLVLTEAKIHSLNSKYPELYTHILITGCSR